MSATHTALTPPDALLEKFTLYVYREGLNDQDCWPYMGPTNRGYGIFIYKAKNIPITKLAWFLAKQEWPARIFRLDPCKDHMCANHNHMTTTPPLHNPNMARRVPHPQRDDSLIESLETAFKRTQTCICVTGNGIVYKVLPYTTHRAPVYCKVCESNWGVVDEDCDIICMMCGRVMGNVPRKSYYSERTY